MDPLETEAMDTFRSLKGYDWIGLVESLIQPGIRILIVLVLWWLLLRAVRIVVGRVRDTLLRRSDLDGESSLEASKRIDTLVRLLRQILNVVLFVTLMLALLMQLGVEVGPLLTSAGIVGVAVGFGAQSLVRDIITGFFIVMENQIRVGDVASINGVAGSIEAMTLRTVVLRDIEGAVHVFPNGAISALANMTRQWSAYVFDIGVAYSTDPDRAIAVIREVLDGLRSDPTFQRRIVAEPELFGVDALADSAVVIKGRIKTLPGAQWDVGREFLRRVKKAFDERGIEIPFQQRTLCVLPESGGDPRWYALRDASATVRASPPARKDVSDSE